MRLGVELGEALTSLQIKKPAEFYRQAAMDTELQARTKQGVEQ